MLEKHLWNTFSLQWCIHRAYRLLEVKDWIVKWYPQTPNNCSWVSKNILCSMHLGKDIRVSWIKIFFWVFVDYIWFRFYVKHIWKNIFLGVQTVPKYIWMQHCPVSGGWNPATCTWNKKFPKGTLRWSEQLLKIRKKQSPGGLLSEDVLKNSAKFTEKHLCRSFVFNKVAGWKPKKWESATRDLL